MAWMNIKEALYKIPDLLFNNRFYYISEGIPITVTGMSQKKKINLIKCGLQKLLSSPFAFNFPPVIHVEPTNMCNLKCRLCPTGDNLITREKGYMRKETFYRILDELGDYLITVILYGWGEPLLHKDFPEFVRACTERNIFTTTSTNGQFIQSIDEALSLVDSGLTGINIAIDGSSEEIYKKTFRSAGEFEKIKRCASLIAEAKRIRNKKNPCTNLRIVVTHQNSDDIQNVEKLARELEADIFTCKKLINQSCSENFITYLPDSGINKPLNKKPLFKCIFPFREPKIFWDGTVVGCDIDYNVELPFGKIGEKKFKDIWNSPNALKLRKAVLTKKSYPDFCRRCHYMTTDQGECFISHKKLNS